VTAVAAIVAIATAQDRFPDGTGKAELLKVCSNCHEAETVFESPQTASQWSSTLEQMGQFGAEATDREWRLIEQYLDAQLARIPVNAAAAEELQRTFDVNASTAQAIVAYRKDKGNFTSIDDLKKVPGLEVAKVDARKDRLVF